MGASGLGFRNVIGQFYARLEPLVADSWANRLSMYIKSDQESETYKWLGMVPGMREWVGGRAAKGFRENGITIAQRRFETTLDLDVDELRRDKTGQINVRIAELAGRVSEHWGELLSALIVAGTTGDCYDGQDFFDASHSESESGTQINLLTASQVTTLNIGTATAPTEDEMAKAIFGVIAYMMGYKDDQGKYMNANARAFTVMVPLNLWEATEGALASRLIASGTGARTNTLADMVSRGKLSIDVVMNPRLASSASAVFHVFRTDAPAKPFIMQEELFETGSKDESFTNNRILVGVKALRNVGYGYWQYATHCTLS